MLVSWFVEHMISGEIFYASFGYGACPKHIDYMQWMKQETILSLFFFFFLVTNRKNLKKKNNQLLIPFFLGDFLGQVGI